MIRESGSLKLLNTDMYRYVFLVNCLLVSLCSGIKDPYSVQVNYTTEIVKNGICTQAVLNDSNCILTTEETPFIEGCSTGYTKDLMACCLVCAKVQRQICGGHLYKHGRCQIGHECLHEILDRNTFVKSMVSNPVAPTGKCIKGGPKNACHKDCCTRSKSLMCGTDGKWYLNGCFLRKANCFRPIGASEIKCNTGRNKTAKCGEYPPNCMTPSKLNVCQKDYNIVFGDPRPSLYYSPGTDVCVRPTVRPTSAAVEPTSRPTSAAVEPASRPTSAAVEPASRPTSAAVEPASSTPMSTMSKR